MDQSSLEQQPNKRARMGGHSGSVESETKRQHGEAQRMEGGEIAAKRVKVEEEEEIIQGEFDGEEEIEKGNCLIKQETDDSAPAAAVPDSHSPSVVSLPAVHGGGEGGDASAANTVGGALGGTPGGQSIESKGFNQFYQSYRGIMRGFVNMIDMGNKGSGGSVEIKVSDKFKVEELFEELYKGKKKHFLFKPVKSKHENVAGKILRNWNVVFDVSGISSLKSIKQETEADYRGRSSKEFMNLVWKRLHKLKVTEKGNDGTQKRVKLFYKSEGYLMPQTDDKIQVFLNSIPALYHETAKKKIDDYYRAIGKLFLHALVSHCHTDDADVGSTLMIPSTALPPFYRQCEWNVYFYLQNCWCQLLFSSFRLPHNFSYHFF